MSWRSRISKQFAWYVSHHKRTTKMLLFCSRNVYISYGRKQYTKFTYSNNILQSAWIHSRLTGIIHSHLVILIFMPSVSFCHVVIDFLFFFFLSVWLDICCSRFAVLGFCSNQWRFFFCQTLYLMEALKCLIHHPDGLNGNLFSTFMSSFLTY